MNTSKPYGEVLRRDINNKIQGNPLCNPIRPFIDPLLKSIRFMTVPDSIKKGDVFMYDELKHPIILYEQANPQEWVCLMMTSNKQCTSIIHKCNSRFFPKDSYFTKTILSVAESRMHACNYMGYYDNNRDLQKAYKKVLESINLIKK